MVWWTVAHLGERWPRFSILIIVLTEIIYSIYYITCEGIRVVTTPLVITYLCYQYTIVKCSNYSQLAASRLQNRLSELGKPESEINAARQIVKEAAYKVKNVHKRFGAQVVTVSLHNIHLQCTCLWFSSRPFCELSIRIGCCNIQWIICISYSVNSWYPGILEQESIVHHTIYPRIIDLLGIF